MSVDCDDVSEQKKVKTYVKSVVSARLASCVDSSVPEDSVSQHDDDDVLDETNFNWNPPRDYFSDECHPSREPFNSSWNYYRTSDGVFSDANVQLHYRRVQIANQFHR
jgi:hypothetical protein